MTRWSWGVVLVFLSGAFCSFATSASAQDRLWRSYLEVEARGTSIRQLGRGNLFLPLAQDGESLVFADFRGLWTDNNTSEGNWGLAYRKMLANDWIVGAHAFYDLRSSSFNNTFHQATIGAELLSCDWGFRANGYIPFNDLESAPGVNGAFLQGNNIVVRQGLEAAYWGVDLEAERLLWCNAGCGPRKGSKSKHQWSLANLDAELWASAGVFHFDHDTNGFQNITGPRVRSELRLYDLPMLGADSRLVLGGQYEYDQVRGSVGSGMLTVRIPFGRGGGSSGYRLTGLRRRMVAPIVRDIDVVTNAAAAGADEQAKIASTNQVVSQAITINGGTAAPETVVAGAGANSVVIADGSAGTINIGGTINMANGQVLMGGGSGLAVIGCDTGSAATFNASGTRPTIDNANNAIDTIVVANDASVLGLDVTATGSVGIRTPGFNALTASSRILDNTVSGAGIGFQFGDVDGILSGNTATGNTVDGYFVQLVNGVVSNNTASGNGFDGFLVSDINAGGQFSNNTATNNGDDGINITDVFGVVSNNTATGNGDNGFELGDLNVGGQLSGNTSTGNMGDGFEICDVFAGAQFTNNTATSNGRDATGAIVNATANGFSFDGTSGTFTGNRAVFNANNGFSNGGGPFINSVGGVFSNNTAITNGDMGYRGINNGTANNNNGSGNTNGGNTFP